MFISIGVYGKNQMTECPIQLSMLILINAYIFVGNASY